MKIICVIGSFSFNCSLWKYIVVKQNKLKLACITKVPSAVMLLSAALTFQSKQNCGFSPQANYTDRVPAACRRS
jgi:hypothetical protein